MDTATEITPSQATTPSPPAPGEYWAGQGGYYICTLPALLCLPERHLIAGKDEAQDLKFGPYLDVPGATSQFDGPTNTAALLATGQDHPAAQWGRSYTADGHTDFHLPSRHDLLMAYWHAPQLFDKDDWYWSSTQHSRSFAFIQGFEVGNSYWILKDDDFRVRAFRWIRT